jgi:outer membrane protein W
MPRFPLPRTRAAARAALLPRLAGVALAGVLAVTPAQAQQPEATFTQRALSAMNESSPVGMLPEQARHPGWQGWFADAWEGSKRIYRDGRSDLLLPFFTFHPPYKFPNRHDQNEYPFGIGLARTWIDSKDNERIVYALAFSDSHYDFQPMVGYGWMARWPLMAGLRGGLGYTVLLSARADANYIPFPAILPLASLGTDRVTVYGTWIPTTDVLFFFARISLPHGEGTSGSATGAPVGARGGTGERQRGNLLYGAGAWVRTDASGIDGVASDNAWAPVVGFRRFVSDRWAIDFSAARFEQRLDLNGATLGAFEVSPLTLAAQYHLRSYSGWRPYAGLGVAYSRITNQQMPGYALSSDSVSPLVQAGVDYAVTDALVLTAGLSVNFMRNQLSKDGALQGTVKLSPVAFSLGLGFAF